MDIENNVTGEPVRTRRRGRRTIVAAVAVVTLGVGAVAAVAAGVTDILPSNPYPTTSNPPSEGDAIPNVTVVENTIKNYYGSLTVPAPAALTTSLGITTMTVPYPTSPYTQEMTKIEDKLKAELTGATVGDGKKKAIVFDIDDTLLNTYNYEIYSNFAYNPTSNAAFVTAAAFPATPGMVKLFNWVARAGYRVFMITGRPEAQRDATVQNLKQEGYAGNFTTANLFLKNSAAPPAYLPCGSTCTTIQYKSGTRAYIESKGYEIVASVGDQYSDLDGGYDDSRVKLPNPMYYLP